MNLFWRVLASVRPTERARFLFFLSLLGLINLAQTLGLVGAESLLLTRFGAGILPQTFVAASLVTVFGSLVYALGVDRSRNDAYFIKILGILALAVGGCAYGAAMGVGWTFPALFCLYYLALAVLTNHFWTFTGDYFDTLSSKRLFPLFTVGGSFGGLAGGLLAGLLASSPTGALLLLAAWVLSLLGAAVLLRTSRRNLRRWGPLELEEADETSFDGMRASVLYLRQSSLGRWLMASAVAMVLSLFVLQYLYSDILAHSFPDERKLAVFLGTFLAATNLLEILLEVVITPFLITRLGVAASNVVHPILTVLSFGYLASSYALPAACVARINRETVENAISGPIRNLVYNALPARFRGRMRAFLEGMVVYTGMVAAGVALLFLSDRLSAFRLCLAGGFTAVIYLCANLKVREEYLKTLITELRAGRLDLSELGSEVGAFELSRLAEVWRRLLNEGAPTKTVLPLIDTFARQSHFEPIVEGLSHPEPRLRRACLRALARYDNKRYLTEGRKALKDPDPSVRLAAVEAFPILHFEDFEFLLDDDDLLVQAEACLRCGEVGDRHLVAMLESHHPSAVSAALERLPVELVGRIDPLCDHPEPAIRAGALECCARHHLDALSLDRLKQHQSSPNSAERLAAVRLLALKGHRDPDALGILARSLRDESREVRQLAAEQLAQLEPMGGLKAASVYLSSESVRTATAAVAAFGQASRVGTREVLARELRERVRHAWTYQMALHYTPDSQDRRLRFLKLSLDNAVKNHRFLAFRILEAVEGGSLIRSVEKVLRFANSRVRADALEVLSNLGDREASSLLVLMLEEGTLDDKLPTVRGQVNGPANFEEVEQLVKDSENPWIRMAAEGSSNGSGEGHGREEVMEHLLVLRQVPLFSQMTLEQLEAINQLLSEEQYLKGEMIFREGDVGDELYIVVEGEVGIFINHGSSEQLMLTTIGAGQYFGEMAILDDEPRSASVVAMADTRVLVLKGEQLKELVFQMPEIAFEIFKVLTGRIRRSDQRLDEIAKAHAEKG